jgi:hypothetical protein
MRKEQLDRQPDERPAEQEVGRHDPNRPEPGRKAPDLPKKDKAYRKPGEHPEGHPIDKTTPKPEPRFGDKEIFEGDRSDRASGRPVQLEDEEETSRR